MSGLETWDLGVCMPNLKFVSLAILELLPFNENEQKFTGSRDPATPPFTQGLRRQRTSFELWTAIIGPQTMPEKCFNQRRLKLRTDGGQSRVRKLGSIDLFVVTSLKILAQFRTTLQLDREYLRTGTRYHQLENDVAICEHSRTY